jgi:hypothetical protein
VRRPWTKWASPRRKLIVACLGKTEPRATRPGRHRRRAMQIIYTVSAKRLVSYCWVAHWLSSLSIPVLRQPNRAFSRVTAVGECGLPAESSPRPYSQGSPADATAHGVMTGRCCRPNETGSMFGPAGLSSPFRTIQDTFKYLSRGVSYRRNPEDAVQNGRRHVDVNLLGMWWSAPVVVLCLRGMWR